MKKLRETLAAFTLASLAVVGGCALTVGVFPIATANANGIDFEGKCGGGLSAYDHAQCQSFVAGVIAGLQISPHPYICFPPSFDRRQGLPIALRWMRNHPGMLNWGPVQLIRQSLRETYPCRSWIPPINN